MSVQQAIVHLIEKKADGSAAILHLREHGLSGEVVEHLVADLNESYNAKPDKLWGYFQPSSENYPLSDWLAALLAERRDFVSFSQQVAERLKSYLEDAGFMSGGHVLLAQYRQGMTDYLSIALLHHSAGLTVTEQLDLIPAPHLDLGQLHLAARINLSEWQQNSTSRQYISLIRGRNGRKLAEAFRECLGCVEGADAAGETRTLLKAFSEYVEAADLPEETARTQTDTLVEYASGQAKRGQPLSIDELSSLLDDENPRAFYEHIRHKDYGLSPEIPADKRTLNQFRRFTGRTEGLSISFDAHLLGNAVQYDEAQEVLIIRCVPEKLRGQLKGSN